MDHRVRTYNRSVRNHDPLLFVKRDNAGTCHLYRKKKVVDHFKYGDITYAHFKEVDDYIISLTDNWWHDGKPVEWGLEPLMRKIHQMDSWTNVNGFENFVKSRERAEQDKERMKRNEIRAHAADLRKDFAKATNDIVVRQETLDKNRDY